MLNAVSLQQPHATLMMLARDPRNAPHGRREKAVETRGTKFVPLGEYAIHSSAKPPKDLAEIWLDNFNDLLGDYPSGLIGYPLSPALRHIMVVLRDRHGMRSFRELPLGQILGVGHLVARFHTGGFAAPTNLVLAEHGLELDADEQQYGNYDGGRYGLIFVRMRVLPPSARVVARGYPGLWTVDAEWEEQIRADLKLVPESKP